MGSIKRTELVVMGASHGGFEALSVIFENLLKNFLIPVIVVYHRSKNSEWNYLHEKFSCYAFKEVLEIDNFTLLKKGGLYFAPPDYHVLFEDRDTLVTSFDDYVNYSRPSIDIMFDSASTWYKENLMGILLTGANNDGAKGLHNIATAGGYTIVQNPAEAVAPEMPRSAMEIFSPDSVASLEEISELMNVANLYFREKL